MVTRNWSILGLALVLAFTLMVGFPGSSQAQQNDSAVAYGPPAQDYAGGYYGYDCSGFSYCPKGPGYGSSAPANPVYRNGGSNAWGQGYQGAWCPWNSGYGRGYQSSKAARNSGYVCGYRGGWGCW